MSGATRPKPWPTARIDLKSLCYKGAAAGPPFLLFLLPLWEKVARMKSAPDEGSLSAETAPSPVSEFATLISSHPLPQGERGRKRHAGPDFTHGGGERDARPRLQM